MKFKHLLNALLVLWLVPALFAAPLVLPPGDQPCAALKDATILVIRHAEKPATGPELNADGLLRAKAYVGYFATNQIDGQPLKLDHIFCTADSTGSHRPRSTVEPLAQALKLPLDNQFKSKEAAGLAAEIRANLHGKNLLICWHHGQIPALLQALGANPEALLPDGEWPPEVFGWMMELRFDDQGRLHTGRCVHENLMPDDRAAATN
jgi:hypothetical protein